jgi:hypothetical protein
MLLKLTKPRAQAGLHFFLFKIVHLFRMRVKLFYRSKLIVFTCEEPRPELVEVLCS